MRAQIAFAGVRKHAENVCSLLRLGCNLERASKGPARSNADKDTLLGSEVLAAANGIGTGDRQDTIDDLHCNGIVGEFGDEIRRPALHRMRLERRMRCRRSTSSATPAR